MLHNNASNSSKVNEDEVELCLELAHLYDQGFPTLNHNHLPSLRNEEEEKGGADPQPYVPPEIVRLQPVHPSSSAKDLP